MVTRYTIDQILSRGTPSSPPAAPSPTLFSTTTHTPLWRPTSLTDGHLDTSHHFTANNKYTESHLKDSKTETLTTGDDEEAQRRIEGRVEDVHPLARPVAVRPAHAATMSPRDTTALEAFGVRPDLGYGGLEGGVYGLMLRQYMEAHYHLGGPRALLPLPFQGFDSGNFFSRLQCALLIKLE